METRIMARLVVLALVGFLTLGAVALGAQEQEVPSKPEVLPLERETALALSAAPPHLRDGAGVYALGSEGFESVRESSNGFTCIVNRDHPLNWKPVCYDAEGSETILPVTLFFGEQLMRETPVPEIRQAIQARFESGEFISPRRPGIAYMLSTEIRNYNARSGQIGGFPPHLMFYGPNLTNEDVGTSFEARRENPWLPFVAYQGPQGFIVVVVGEGS